MDAYVEQSFQNHYEPQTPQGARDGGCDGYSGWSSNDLRLINSFNVVRHAVGEEPYDANCDPYQSELHLIDEKDLAYGMRAVRNVFNWDYVETSAASETDIWVEPLENGDVRYTFEDVGSPNGRSGMTIHIRIMKDGYSEEDFLFSLNFFAPVKLDSYSVDSFDIGSDDGFTDFLIFFELKDSIDSLMPGRLFSFNSKAPVLFQSIRTFDKFGSLDGKVYAEQKLRPTRKFYTYLPALGKGDNVTKKSAQAENDDDPYHLYLPQILQNEFRTNSSIKEPQVMLDGEKYVLVIPEDDAGKLIAAYLRKMDARPLPLHIKNTRSKRRTFANINDYLTNLVISGKITSANSLNQFYMQALQGNLI